MHALRRLGELPDLRGGQCNQVPATGRLREPHIGERVLVDKALVQVEQANAALEHDREVPLPERITPHSLRRTYASLLFAIGRTAPEVMDQLGHTDPS